MSTATVGPHPTASRGSFDAVVGQARHLYVFQRTPNFGLPARNGPQDPEKAGYPPVRAKARVSGNGYALLGDVPAKGALEVSDEERRATYERCWQIGGVGNYRIKCDEVAAKGYEGFVLGAGVAEAQARRA